MQGFDLDNTAITTLFGFFLISSPCELVIHLYPSTARRFDVVKAQISVALLSFSHLIVVRSAARSYLRRRWFMVSETGR